jgi:hypothetical protein
MTEETGTPKTPTSKKSSQLAIFSEQPLLDGEDPAVYKELFEHISVAVKPLDIFEEIWVREIVVLVWEIFRLCYMKRNLRAAAEFDAVASEAVPLLFDEARKPEAIGKEALNELLQSEKGEWNALNPQFQKLDKIWKKVLMRVDHDRAKARAFVQQLDNIERIDRLTTILQGRRNSILREIAHHRANFGQVLRERIGEIEEAEFETIQAETIAPTGLENKSAV